MLQVIGVDLEGSPGTRPQ